MFVLKMDQIINLIVTKKLKYLKRFIKKKQKGVLKITGGYFVALTMLER